MPPEVRCAPQLVAGATWPDSCTVLHGEDRISPALLYSLLSPVLLYCFIHCLWQVSPKVCSAPSHGPVFAWSGAEHTMPWLYKGCGCSWAAVVAFVHGKHACCTALHGICKCKSFTSHIHIGL